MIDENNTQQSITPKIVFENVTAAVALAERLLNSTENVGEFNGLVKSTAYSDGNKLQNWTANQFGQANL